MIKFSLRLKELRTSKKLSQQNLANYISVSKSSINMYERGEREPSLETLEELADFFNVDFNYLIGKSDVPNRYAVNADEGYTLYDRLDTEDKAEIRGEMKHMLKADKYSAESETKE